MKYISSLLLSILSIQIAVSGNSLKGPEIWQQVFVPTLVEKFHRETTNLKKIEGFLHSKGGNIIFDHGATRTADPEVYKFLQRLAGAMGLKVHGHYTFASKHIEAVDMQLPGQNKFKWFMTQIKYHELSPIVANHVALDIKNNSPQFSQKGMELLEKLENTKQLTQDEAEEFVREIVYGYLKRHGHPIPKGSLTRIEKESPETANALLLGPDFNHVALSMNDLHIKEWENVSPIEAIHSELPKVGIPVLKTIQGAKGSKLQQTSALAEHYDFPILSEDSVVLSHSHPSRFIEFIQRGGSPELFTGFLAENAEVIYTSTTRSE